MDEMHEEWYEPDGTGGWRKINLPKDPPDTSGLTPLSNDDGRDHSIQLKMLYAQQRKSNKLPHALIERCEYRFVHTFVD